MRTTMLHHRIFIGALLATLAPAAAAQGVPRDEYPLPPASEIRPLGTGEAGEKKPGEPRPVGGLTDIHEAHEALDELLRAYEAGNVALIQRRLDPAMVGYQVFLDGVRRDANAYKNLRINLTDTQITAGPDLAVIQIAWEKRFLAVSDFTPGIFTGRSTILMHRDGDGWQLAAVALDNPFSSASGTLARFKVLPASLVTGSLVGFVPVQVEVVDPDMAGLGTVRVAVTGSDGDRETLTLPATSPGVFRIATLNMLLDPGGAIPNNNVLELAGAGSFTFRYVDPNPGDNRPASTLTRVVRVR